MKTLLAFTVCMGMLLPVAFAQTSEYDKAAADIKTEIWGGKDADFESNTVPDQYKNESAIILAKRYDLDAKIKKHFRLSMGIGNKEIIFRYLLRQKVLLQDKSALEDFSEISYNKVSSNSYGMLWGKQTDNLSTYIGAKVYKKDGTVKEVMLSEAVLVKDEKNSKDEKLAIPDLQVGDILDYYIVSLEKREMSSIDPMQFVMGGEYPILKISLKGNVDKKYAIEYKCINGTPDLKISKDEDGDMQFAIKMTDLPKFPVTQWTSPLRQAKVVRLKISLCGGNYSNCKAGEITKGVTEDEIYTTQKERLRGIAFQYSHDMAGSAERNYIRQNMKLLKKRLGKEPPVDSVVACVYNSLRYYGYYSALSNYKIYPGKSRNQTSLPSNLFSVFLSLSLKEYDVDNELIFYSSRYMPKIEELMSYDQPVFMVHVKTAKEYYLTDDGIFSQIGLVPGYAEGEKGVTLEYDNAKALYRDKAKHMDQGTAKIPVSAPDKNKILESFRIALTLGASPASTVDRQITATGLMKEDLQKNLMLFEDYYTDAWKDQGDEHTFIQEFADNRRTKSLAEEWQNSFSKSRETYKEAFIQDIKGDYNEEPKELIDYKIDHSGVRLREQAFTYTTKFVITDWIRKAGNNYLFEIGKVIGNQLQIKEEDRKRSIDVYAPFARTFEYRISVPVPEGFSVEGVEALNKKIDNDCGKFVSVAAVKGDLLEVDIQKEYSHNYEPASNWPKMLEFIDAASDFGTTKVLLKKK